jgi:DNA-directed RNA polymerase specialized sigma24 family protein
MLALTHEDQQVLASLACECSREEEAGQTLQILIDGFSRYGEERFVEKYASREEYFREKYRPLLENIGFAGRTYEEVFSSKSGRDSLCQMVRGEGVPSADVEDVVQEICRKFWKAQWVERYNPLRASWRVFLHRPVQRYVRTYRVASSRRVITHAVRLDEEDGTSSRSSTMSFLYDPEYTGPPEDMIFAQEIMSEWEDFLKSQPPLRESFDRTSRRLCTLLPPGTEEIPATEERPLFFLGGGYYNSRVTTEELYRNGLTYMVPNELLVDYICENEVTGEPAICKETGEVMTRKDYPNPDFNPDAVTVKIRRRWIDLYHRLKEGRQVEEIAQIFRMAPPSVPAWIQKLEGLFRSFWLISTKIPVESKILATKTYQCPHCHRLERIQRDECRLCGWDMEGVRAEIRFDAYPWPRVYTTQKTRERLGDRKPAVLVQRCSLSARV